MKTHLFYPRFARAWTCKNLRDKSQYIKKHNIPNAVENGKKTGLVGIPKHDGCCLKSPLPGTTASVQSNTKLTHSNWEVKWSIVREGLSFKEGPVFRNWLLGADAVSRRKGN